MGILQTTLLYFKCTIASMELANNADYYAFMSETVTNFHKEFHLKFQSS